MGGMTHGYVEWAPATDLTAIVACLWRGRVGDPDVPYTDRVLPDACVDVIWDGARLFVAGPDTRPVVIARTPMRDFVGIRIGPGRAAGVAGCPVRELRDRRVDVAELWGPRRARQLTDEIAAAAGAHAVARLLERAVRTQVARRPPPDRLVDGVVASLEQRLDGGPGLVDRLAAEIGVTARTLHRRCSDAFGYGPKTLDRIVRFRRAQRLARNGPSMGLGALAAAAGYADQAHLTRECRRLSGLTPARLFGLDAPIVRDRASETSNTRRRIEG